MDTLGPRIGTWLDTIGDLLRVPLTSMPHTIICDQLVMTFDATAALQVSSDEQGRQEFVCQPVDAFGSLNERMELWNSGHLARGHAVLRWYGHTNDLAPMTMGRVPVTLVSRRLREPVNAPMRALGLDQQLWIVSRRQGRTQRGFAVGRGSSDFSDEDLTLARYVQRALVGLEMQVAVLQQLLENPDAADLGLTGREQAVLVLICDGHTSRTAGRALSCSPRTIDKHLERIYRKLDVRDRVNAMRIAHLAGLVTPKPAMPVRGRL